MTLAGIEPTTFCFVAQHLNHCATAVPQTQVHIVNINSGTSNCQYFQRIIQLSGFSTYPDGCPSRLIRISGVLLYVKKNGVRKIAKNSFGKIQYFIRLKCLLVTGEERRVSVLPSPLLSSYRRKYPDEY